MKVFHQDRARKQRIAIGVLATSMLAGVLGFAPAAQAQPNWIEVDCSESDFVAAVTEANTTTRNIIVLDDKCKYEFERPVAGTANALPVVTDTLTIYGNKSKVEADGDWFFRFMETAEDVSVTIRDLTIEDFELAIPAVEVATEPAGGAILAHGPLTLRNSTVKDNEVFVLNVGPAGGLNLMGGGGVAGLDASVTLTSSTVSGNDVTLVNILNGVGGANIAAAGGVGIDGTGDDAPNTLRIDGSTVKGNKVSATGLYSLGWAAAGGAAAVDGAVMDMDGSSVSSNSVSAKSNVNINFAGVDATLAEAGGVYLGSGTHDIDGSTIDSNKASAKGGTIALGGGLVNIGTLTMDGGSISKNKASCDDVCLALGGGYANTSIIANGGVLLPVGPVGTAVFTGVTFTKNVADGDDGVGLGGGLLLAGDGGPAETRLVNSTITKNEAKGDVSRGGGIFAQDLDAVDVDDSVISKNKPDNCYALFTGPFWCNILDD